MFKQEIVTESETGNTPTFRQRASDISVKTHQREGIRNKDLIIAFKLQKEACSSINTAVIHQHHREKTDL